jgi:hypothetical protein
MALPVTLTVKFFGDLFRGWVHQDDCWLFRGWLGAVFIGNLQTPGPSHELRCLDIWQTLWRAALLDQ